MQGRLSLLSLSLSLSGSCAKSPRAARLQLRPEGSDCPKQFETVRHQTCMYGTSICIYLQTGMHTYIHQSMHAYMHATHIHTYTHIHAYMHSCMHAYVHKCIPKVHVLIHVHIHVHINMHIHIHTHACIRATLLLWAFLFPFAQLRTRRLLCFTA